MVVHETTTNVLRHQNNNKTLYSQTLQKDDDINLLRVIKTSETIGFVRSTKGHFYQGFVCYSHPNNNCTFVDEVLHKKLKVSHLIGVVWAV